MAHFSGFRQIGGPDEEQARSIVADSAGRIYTAGFFNGHQVDFFNSQVDFDPGSSEVIFAASGGQNAFVSELNAVSDFLDVVDRCNRCSR